RVFRNEGLSTEHNPEFTLLEFYQAGATYEDLMALTEEMLVGLAREVTGGTRLAYRGHDLELAPPRPPRTMVGLVAARPGRAAAPWGEPAGRLLEPATVRGLAERTGGIERPGMSPGELLIPVFERLVEPELVQPTFVCQFPVEVSPLARRNDCDPRFVDRFELYVARHEIANEFSELNDPDDQRARFEAQIAARAAGDAEAHPMDQDSVP